MSEDYYKTLIKGIIENNDKEEAIKIIANNLNKKQISNEKEILANIEKAIEIERLKKELEKYKYSADELNEIERLNNIINELEKYLDEQVDYMTHHSIERMIAFDCCRHKLQELKGSDKDDNK